MTHPLLSEWFEALWQTMLEASPWFLLGLVAAGVLHAGIPNTVIASMLRTPGPRSVIKAALIGVPLPLCSCGVLPVAVSFRRGGASRGATASFLVSTPEVGVDSFFLSWALLGVPMAILRVIAAFFTAILVGFGIEVLSPAAAESGQVAPEKTRDASPASDSCGKGACGSDSCCDSMPGSSVAKPGEEGASNSFIGRFRVKAYRGIRFVLVDLLDDIGPSLVLGLLISAAISVLLPPNSVSPGSLGSWAMMGVILAIAIPLYVCASGSTPIAAALLAKGFSPGSVLVFLLAGPATNAAAVLVIARELGKRAAAIYVGGIGVIAIIFGIAVDRIFPALDLTAAIATASHAEMHSAGGTISAVVLLLLLIRPLAKAMRRTFVRFSGPREGTARLPAGRSECL